ncbi:MAG: hypothetical protein ACHP9V_06395 [Terriglobales bacterium]
MPLMIGRAFLTLVHFLVGWGGLILGGIYGFVQGFSALLRAMDELFYRFRDYAVYEVIDTPKPRSNADHAIVLSPYYVNEIAAKLGRSIKSVQSSLKRLKRNGKAIETLIGGWYSREIAPSNAKTSFLM